MTLEIKQSLQADTAISVTNLLVIASWPFGKGQVQSFS